MKKSSGIWMAALTFTAIIMGVILLATPPREAQAVMLNAQAGFSLMTTGAPNNDEVLIVIDKTSEKMVMYKLNGNNLDPMAGINFGKVFGAGN